jgi:hypothetical protein
MARLSLRDRFFTPPVARAITSPSGILSLGAGAAAGILIGAGPVGAVVVGLLAFAGRVGLAIPRASGGSKIDPFTLAEPWRYYVRDAVQAKARFEDAVRSAKDGPMRDRLREIEARVTTGVEEVWRIAQRGHDLVDARRRVDPDAIRAEVAAAERDAPRHGDDPTYARMLEALHSQLATAERIERVISDTDSRLRLLNARLDEAAARTIELSVQANDVAELGGLGDDVDSMVEEMEALRQAIEEAGGGTAVAGTA